MDAPKTVEEIYEDFCGRRAALVAALTTDVAAFFDQCDPNKENLCLYGRPDGTWRVELPAEEVPPELPEPALGVNFARDGMARKDWLALVAVHSDAWLVAVAFYFAAKFNAAERARLFGMVNQLPTVYKALSGEDGKPGAAGAKKKAYPAPAPSGGKRERQDPECYEKPSPGRILSPKDNLTQLQGATIELYWPDDGLWYRAEILSLNPRGRSAKVLYSTGDVESLQLDEVINDGHLNVVRV